MGVSKIVREIEGIVGDEWGCEGLELGNGNGLSGVKGLVNWGVFGKWMGVVENLRERGLRGEWWLSDDWFVESLGVNGCVNSG